MLEQELDKQIEKRIDGLLHSLEYQLESMCWVVGSIESIKYLIFLKEKFNNNSHDNE